MAYDDDWVVFEEFSMEPSPAPVVPIPLHHFASVHVILLMLRHGSEVADHYLFGGMVIARAAELLESDLLTKGRITRDIYKDRISQMPLPPVWQSINHACGAELYSMPNWPRMRAAQRRYLKDVESPDYCLIIQILRHGGGPPEIITLDRS